MLRHSASESREAAATGPEPVGMQRSPAGKKPSKIMARTHWTRLGAPKPEPTVSPKSIKPKKVKKLKQIEEVKEIPAAKIAHKALARFKRPRGMKEPLRILSTVLRLEQHYRFSRTRNNRDVLLAYIAKSVRYATLGGMVSTEARLGLADCLLDGLVDRVWRLVDDSTFEGIIEEGTEVRRVNIKGRDLLLYVRAASGRKRILEVATGRVTQRYANRRRHPRQGRRHLALL